jgi:hypothetical protein
MRLPFTITPDSRSAGLPALLARFMAGRLLLLVGVVVVALSSTGCGIITSRPSKGDLAIAHEGLLHSNKRPPSQLTAQSGRVLPKPEFGVTPEVQVELDRFMTSDRKTVLRLLDESAPRYEATKKVFEGQGVPTELLSVAAVESGFNPKAASPAGARGMWQFMKGTARLYGLKVSRIKDERLDPNLSTEAAAKHLRDLFALFQDWHLVLAAYNAGSGAVNRLLTSQGENDFWELSRGGHLPRETQKFVPRVIALSLIFSDPSRYGFNDMKLVG